MSCFIVVRRLILQQLVVAQHMYTYRMTSAAAMTVAAAVRCNSMEASEVSRNWLSIFKQLIFATLQNIRINRAVNVSTLIQQSMQ